MAILLVFPALGLLAFLVPLGFFVLEPAFFAPFFDPFFAGDAAFAGASLAGEAALGVFGLVVFVLGVFGLVALVALVFGLLVDALFD